MLLSLLSFANPNVENVALFRLFTNYKKILFKKLNFANIFCENFIFRAVQKQK